MKAITTVVVSVQYCDGEEISTTVTMPDERNGKNLPLPYDL